MGPLVVLSIATTFVLSLVLCSQGWGLLNTPRREPAILLQAGFIAAGCIGVGLPHLLLAIQLCIGTLLALPFTACLAVVCCVPSALRAERPPVRWGAFRVTCAVAGAVTGTAVALSGDSTRPLFPWLDASYTHAAFDVGFALGCLCIGLGVGGLPGAIRSSSDAVKALRFSLLASLYAMAPLVGLGIAHLDPALQGALTRSTNNLEIAASPYLRGLLACAAAGLVLVLALWARAMALLDDEDAGSSAAGDAVAGAPDAGARRAQPPS